MKSFIKKLKQKLYRFLTAEINSKLDKILMLEAAILARENMKLYNFVRTPNWGGGDLDL